jgi:hypothetical protein
MGLLADIATYRDRLLDAVDEKDISEQGEYKWKMALKAYDEVDVRIEAE